MEKAPRLETEGLTKILGGTHPKDEGFPLVIVDTSVAIKWFFPEEGSTEARELLQDRELGAPDLLLYEFSNFLALRGDLSHQAAQDFLSRFYRLPLQFLVLPEKGMLRTVDLARRFLLTAYDASFVALAESLKADFVTADLKLLRKVKSLPFVRGLTE